MSRLRKPSIITLRNEFHAVCRDGKVTNTSKAEQSGIVEAVSDTDELLDELIHEQMERGSKGGRTEMSLMDERRQWSRQERWSEKPLRIERPEEDVASSSRTPKKKRVDSDEMEEWNEMIRAELQNCQGREKDIFPFVRKTATSTQEGG